MRRWLAASLTVVAALYAGVTERWALASAIAALILVALAEGARLALSLSAVRVVSALAAVAGGALGWIFEPVVGAPLTEPWAALALAGLLAGAASLLQAPLVKGSARLEAAALLPGLVALTACGEAPIGPRYAIVVVVHLAFALLALRAGDTGGFPWRGLATRRHAMGAALVGLAAAVATALALALPPLSGWAQGRVLRALGGAGAETGFSDRLWLGSLDSMLQSDEVVLRLDGARTDYLRGASYDHYEIGRWGRRHPARPEPVSLPPSLPPSAERARVITVSGTRDRYFVPLGAHAVTAADPLAAVDRFGILRTGSLTDREISFETRGAPSFPVADPSPDDLDVPPNLRGVLQRLAAAWTVGATTPAARVSAIATRLRTTYTYSLHFDHNRRLDPLLDFLLDDHQGHCEYFATAMTLLARAAGVPARVAIGYRVGEENPLGGYWVVRERNAHAWSEVFLEGRGFVTVDATPAGAVSQNEPHRGSMFGSVWDLIGSAWARVTARLGPLQVAGALSLVLVAGLVWRRLRQARGPREARTVRKMVEKPPPSLAKLLDALALRGAVRPAWEPLERFAARLAEPELGAAAALLRRWAAFRYGGEGDGEALSRELEGCAERLRRR